VKQRKSSRRDVDCLRNPEDNGEHLIQQLFASRLKTETRREAAKVAHN
jgi:hypothetical protein